MEPLAARYDHVEVRALGEQRGQRGGRVDDVLEVVEHKEQPPLTDRLLQRPRDSERAGSRLGNRVGIADGRKRHPPDTGRITIRRLTRRLQGEPRLPAAAGAREREQADVGVRK